MKIRFTINPGRPDIGETIILSKEPGNAFDSEAYYKLRKPGTYSAGRLLDKIPDTCQAVIVADQVGEVEVA